MAFATRSKFFWSRFIATSVKYLGVANTQQIRFLAEKLLPTEMSRQNILYHVRIAEEKGWITSFASALEMTDENKVLFREAFQKIANEKISAQRFVMIGIENFEPVAEEKIIQLCKLVKLEPISIIEPTILELVTEDLIKRLSSTKEKAAGNKSLFMALMRFGWFWLNINPERSLKIIEVLKKNASKHHYNENYKIDTDLLEIASMIDLEMVPELDIEDLEGYLNECIRLITVKKRPDVMNLMSITLLISGRYLVAFNKLPIAENYLNRGIKYLRFCERKTILMRKLYVDGLFDLGFIYAQQGWFHKALGLYENIELIIEEEFVQSEPTNNLRGKLALAKVELYLMMAFPSYIFHDKDYRSSLFKALKFASNAIKHYQVSGNQLKITEIMLLNAWIYALLGKLLRSEQLLKKATKQLIAPVPPKLNVIYYNTQAEIYRKQGNFSAAIKDITISFDYLKIFGNLVAKLFSMTRLSELHVQLSSQGKRISFISFGDVTHLFEKEVSDMLGHVFLESVKMLSENSAMVSFYLPIELITNHPEINDYVEFFHAKEVSPVLLGESFTIIPTEIINPTLFETKKAICILGSLVNSEISNEYQVSKFSDQLTKFDDRFQKLLIRNQE